MSDETTPSGGGEPVFTEKRGSFDFDTPDRAFTVRLWLTGTISVNEAEFLTNVARGVCRDGQPNTPERTWRLIGDALAESGVLEAVEVTDNFGSGEVAYYRW